MADNLPVTPSVDPTARQVATDQIGGVDYQRVKLTWGVDGVASDVSAGAPLPVSFTTPVSVTMTPELATVVNEGSVAITAATAQDVITATGTPCGMAIRNRGPNDASYRVGATATGAGTERVLLAGEEKTLPYRTDKKISAYSTLGTTIEWEQWS